MASVEGPRTPLTGDGHYRLLVDAITDYAVYMLDPSGVVVSWNPGARRFKGYDAHEIVGQHFSRFYTEEDRRGDLPARALATAAKEGRFEAEGWRLRKDKTRSGRTSSSIRSAMMPAASSDLQKSRGT
jgi:PAS domain S-box-containing protein